MPEDEDVKAAEEYADARFGKLLYMVSQWNVAREAFLAGVEWRNELRD